jgi:hypothetical protein
MDALFARSDGVSDKAGSAMKDPCDLIGPTQIELDTRIVRVGVVLPIASSKM